MNILSEILHNYLDSHDQILTLKSGATNGQKFGDKVQVFDKTFDINNINRFDIAIIGVKDDRNTTNKSFDNGVTIIRKYLYDLYAVNSSMKVIDLGNLKPGITVEDTYFALIDILRELISIEIIPVIIGAGHDLTYPQYMAYSKKDELVNLTTIDNKLDIGNADSEFSASTYLSKIILEDGEHLFNYTNLGYQKYLVSQESIDMMSKLYFDTYRAGEVQSNISMYEPVLRDSNLVSLDLSVIRMSDSPGSNMNSPNGLFGNEVCQLAFYSGVSDNVTSFGIYEYNPENDMAFQTGQLSAQIIWHFIEGYYLRREDILDGSEDDLKKYSIEVTVSDHKIVFLHSPKTNRWWIIVPSQAGSGTKNRIVSCSSDDYNMAVKGELPDRWWKTFQLTG